MFDEQVVQQIAAEVSEKFIVPADLAARIVQYTLFEAEKRRMALKESAA